MERKTEVSADRIIPKMHFPQRTPFSMRNYLAHSIEGGLYAAGMTFLAQETVMPAMIKSLGGSNWLVSLMPMMAGLGFSWLPLFTAHHIERLPVVKPLILKTGVFQRIPYLIAALSLLLMTTKSPRFVLYAVAFAPFISGAVGGISYSAWLELISKTIPEKRRASSWAIRFFISSITGVLAGGIISRVLLSNPGPRGYAILHFIALGFITVSYIVIATVKETAHEEARHKTVRNLATNLATIPALLRAEPHLRHFMISRLLSSGIFVLIPFMSIHVLETLGKSEHFLGVLVTAQMVGGIAGNILAGKLGDKLGGRFVLSMGMLGYCAVSVAVLAVGSAWGFIVIFFLFGMAFYMNMVGDFTLSVEMCAPDRRPTYLSFLASLRFVSMLAAAALSTLLRETSGNLFPASLIAICTLSFSMYFLGRIREPRARSGQGPKTERVS